MTNKFPFPGKNILLAEDNIDNQDLMKDMAEMIDCQIDIANNGLEAIEMWKNKKYDLIIMDIHMPKMDGYRATQEIRKLENGTGHVPILALTASALLHDRDRCFECGMDDCLIKPINIDILEKKLSELFQKFS